MINKYRMKFETLIHDIVAFQEDEWYKLRIDFIF